MRLCEFPGLAAQRNLLRSKQIMSQGAKRYLILLNPVLTAAKRRKGAGNCVPCWGLGMKSPSRVWGGNPIVPHMREAQFIISQGAKRHLTDA